ncbi:hypothetical protein [Marinobacter shengliensis]|uniref:hypothetical protein n=1 Tax=Marinobacter shengliensis TaxID=1389223 RepID=UPI00110988C3|nr:hypothetical protein [Marinobacter shengliensis]
MGANYIYVPQSVEGVTGLESVLKHKDLERTVLFRGVRLAQKPLTFKQGVDAPAEKDIDHDSVLIMLQSDLDPSALGELIEDHSRSFQQGHLIPLAQLETTTTGEFEFPVGAGNLILPGTSEGEYTYFGFEANMDIARRHCRVNMMPEIILDPDVALDRFHLLRRELELYLGYGVRKFTDFQSSFADLDQDRLMKAVRLVDIVTEEIFPKFKDCLFETEFREDFLEAFMVDFKETPLDDSGLIGQRQGNDLFILFSLIRDLQGTRKLLDSLPDSVSGDLRRLLGRIVR